eukprot:209092_1
MSKSFDWIIKSHRRDPDEHELHIASTASPCHKCHEYHDFNLHSNALQTAFEERKIRREFSIRSVCTRISTIETQEHCIREPCSSNCMDQTLPHQIDLWWKLKTHYPNDVPHLFVITLPKRMRILWFILFILQIALTIYQFLYLSFLSHMRYIAFTFCTLLAVGVSVYIIGKYMEQHVIDWKAVWRDYPKVLDSRYNALMQHYQGYTTDMETFLLCTSVSEYCASLSQYCTLLSTVIHLLCIALLFVCIIYVPVLVSYELSKSVPLNQNVWVIPDMFDWMLDFNYFLLVIDPLCNTIHNRKTRQDIKKTVYHLCHAAIAFVMREHAIDLNAAWISRYSNVFGRKPYNVCALHVIENEYIECLRGTECDHKFDSLDVCRKDFRCALSVQNFQSGATVRWWNYLLWNEAFVFYIWCICIVWRYIMVIPNTDRIALGCQLTLDVVFGVLLLIYTWVQIDYVENYFDKKTRNIDFWLDERLLMYVNDAICKNGVKRTEEWHLFETALEAVWQCLDEYVRNDVAHQMLLNYKNGHMPQEIVQIIIEYVYDKHCVQHAFDRIHGEHIPCTNDHGFYNHEEIKSEALNCVQNISKMCNELDHIYGEQQ